MEGPGDSDVAEEIVRRPLPVPGAWGYGREGDVVVFVFDNRFTEDEIAQKVTEVMTQLPPADGKEPSA